MLENDLGGTPATAMPSAARRVRGRLQIPPIQHVHELGDSRLTHHQESSILQHVVIGVRRGVLEFGNRKQVGAIRDAKFGLCLYGGSYHFRLAAADTAVEQLVTVAAPNRGRRDPGYRFHIYVGWRRRDGQTWLPTGKASMLERDCPAAGLELAVGVASSRGPSEDDRAIQSPLLTRAVMRSLLRSL